ncbi:unnamed protein product [marine sediment metagenome]|uniref:Uncharacterized protein n=1 Tax=marine sediment metagenome TaxID=412755 RepID=X0T936_9ZZZZ
MSYEQQTDVSTIVIETCCNCGIRFGLPKEFQDRLRDKGEDFYCPNGHVLHYSDTIQNKLAEAKRRAEYLEAGLEAQCDETAKEKRRRVALRGVITRTKNRISNGVCPCCKRQFKNLHNHMKTKHPNY